MKVTLGDKLGAGLDKLRLELPVKHEEGDFPASTPESPKPVVGVVVPDPNPRPKPPSGPLHIRLKPPRGAPTPDQIDEYYMGYPPGEVEMPRFDEGQLAGELLDWLFEKGFFKATVTRTSLLAAQKRFFEERDQ